MAPKMKLVLHNLKRNTNRKDYTELTVIPYIMATLPRLAGHSLSGY
jgi:hypothetical protein